MQTTTSFQIGDRVRLNDNVACAFIGQCGAIESTKPDPAWAGRTLYIVKLDTPTPAATNWTPIETLGVSEACMELL